MIIDWKKIMDRFSHEGFAFNTILSLVVFFHCGNNELLEFINQPRVS